MTILTIRTDQPEADLGLFEDTNLVAHANWQAHRELSKTIHQKIAELLGEHQKVPADIQGIVCFKGPGSFTGLRIGLTVANTLAYSFGLPIVGTTGQDWQQTGIAALLSGENEKTVLPEYGAEAHITQQKK